MNKVMFSETMLNGSKLNMNSLNYAQEAPVRILGGGAKRAVGACADKSSYT